jgi:hypothetical protein
MYGLRTINPMFTAGCRADFIIVGNKDYHTGRIGAEIMRPAEEWERKARANLPRAKGGGVRRGPKPQTLARIEEMSRPRQPLPPVNYHRSTSEPVLRPGATGRLGAVGAMVLQ